ncbi:MAG: GxxExxY protein [Planctomycetaceae bacterium]|nr:GxxExxY protein [Planctomycetaceae bacterium]
MMSRQELLHSEKTEEILSSFYHVYNQLGFGFLEKVYENALLISLRKKGFQIESQKSIEVYFEGEQVGKFYADLIVDNLVILEIKAVDQLQRVHETQLLNYLRATPIEVGLLLNFGEKPSHRRRIFTNDRKDNFPK